MKNRTYKIFMRGFTILSLMAFSLVSYAQHSVSGTVLDETGQASPGVSVIEKGTTNGTATDVNGKYSLSVSDEDATLVFSFIGYETQEVPLAGKTALDVNMTLDITALEEVVVTGYTEQRQRDITGAVTVIDADKLKSNKAANFGQMLAGRAAGITSSNSGEPGGGTNIRIRGISSFSGSDPLIIVDGIQIQGDKQLNGLNPNDIESMQVLKDAAAASIYGARASAGVVIITTKQGKAGKVKITYDGYVGTQAPVGGYNDFLIKDPLQYAEYQLLKTPSLESFYGSATNPSIPTYFFPVDEDGNPVDADESEYFPYGTNSGGNLIMRSNAAGTDWWDETFKKNAVITNHNIGLSGGSESATYSASLDYFKQDGTMRYTGLERFSARINSAFTLGRFKLGESLSFSRTTGVNMAGGNQNEQNVMTNILKLNSIVPVYDVGGNFAGAKTTGFSNGLSPVAQAWRNKDNRYEYFNLLGSVFGELKITDWLKARSNFAFNYNNGFFPNFAYPRWEVRETNSTSTYTENWVSNFNWTYTNFLEANKTFAGHTIKAFGGIEANRAQYRNINGSLINYVSFDVVHRYLNQALGTFNTIQSSQAITTLYSMFGKVDYEYNDKILASATVRRDGSSAFVENKYGVFPAFSLGYRISEEAFMSNVSWLTDLKIRGGWGRMGNATLPSNVRYNTYDQYGAKTPFDASYDITGSNTSAASGLTRTAIGNSATTWETNTTTNIGFDARFLDGKFSLVLDIYKKDVDDLLFNAPLPGTAGNASPPVSNVASMTNKGWDVNLGYKGYIASDIDVSVDMNLSHYTNVINTLDGSATLLFPGGVDKRFGEVNAWIVGEPISTYYGYILDGIFQNDAEVAALGQPGSGTGRFRWKDINGDGKINDDDKVAIGNPHPDLTAGLNIALGYKNFDFTMFLFGSFGNEIYNYNKLFSIFGQFASNVDKRVLTDSWTPESGGSLPAIDVDDTQSNLSSTFYVEDGTYVRANNVTVGYSLQPIPAIGIQKLRVYVQAQNLFTITGYSGIDPAISSVNVGQRDNQGNGQNDGWAGFDFGNYPSSRSIILGVNVGF